MSASHKKPRHWVIVADQASATFYTQEKKHGHLHKEFSLENSAAHKKTSELLADRGGRSFDSKGKARHTMSKHVDPKEHEAQVFAKAVAKKLAKLKPEIAAYTLVAPPRFLGDLRKAMEIAGCAMPDITMDKEYTDRDVAAIEQFLNIGAL
jgi:protein required for attachment to host cells